MKPTHLGTYILIAVVVAAVGLGAYFTQQTWKSWFWPVETAEPSKTSAESATTSEKVIVTEQAQKNLGVTADYLKLVTFQKTIVIPGMVIDRPGVSDRGVIAPVTGIVSTIHHLPGDTIRAGDTLFTIKLLSESLHLTQTDLRKAAQDIKILQADLKRLTDLGGSIPMVRLIEINNQLARLETSVRAHSQELLNRGLSEKDVTAIRDGGYISEVHVVAPPRDFGSKPLGPRAVASPLKDAATPAFELQDLKVDIGQQVQPGQILGTLSNHRSLFIEGKGFPDEMQLLHRSFKERWPVEVQFSEDPSGDWGPATQAFFIRSVGNSIDPGNRTFSFQIPLENQVKQVTIDHTTKLVWRYRPGQKVRIRVRVEEVKDVFVLPADAVVRDGAEAYVFTQNVNTFERKGVVVLFQEGGQVIIANDGSLPTYQKDKEDSKTNPKEKETWTIPAVAQSAAAQLHRMGRSGSTGVPKGYHIHADGSLHKNEDEGK